ncbi:hypothetical protein KPH14_000732 [Odynerus spinipes]|uniref:Uncharacterized protein n=1 Tax=Odynerus spinipes TaxID=1348599 RepID=A0AAD9RDR1_9HYME|nr:hypothetical protein KPH14_000732 [Odynerus spinipes]
MMRSPMSINTSASKAASAPAISVTSTEDDCGTDGKGGADNSTSVGGRKANGTLSFIATFSNDFPLKRFPPSRLSSSDDGRSEESEKLRCDALERLSRRCFLPLDRRLRCLPVEKRTPM